MKYQIDERISPSAKLMESKVTKTDELGILHSYNIILCNFFSALYSIILLQR